MFSSLIKSLKYFHVFFPMFFKYSFSSLFNILNLLSSFFFLLINHINIGAIVHIIPININITFSNVVTLNTNEYINIIRPNKEFIDRFIAYDFKSVFVCFSASSDVIHSSICLLLILIL